MVASIVNLELSGNLVLFLMFWIYWHGLLLFWAK